MPSDVNSVYLCASDSKLKECYMGEKRILFTSYCYTIKMLWLSSFIFLVSKIISLLYYQVIVKMFEDNYAIFEISVNHEGQSRNRSIFFPDQNFPESLS